MSPNTFFAQDRYGEMIDLVELTRPSDGYENESRLLAATSHMSRLRSDLKMMIGARYESFQQDLSVASPLRAGRGEPRAEHEARPRYLACALINLQPLSSDTAALLLWGDRGAPART